MASPLKKFDGELDVLNLQKAAIDRNIPTPATGIYYLGTLQDGCLSVQYVGRSDTDLRRRLLQHTSEGKFTFFSFRLTKTILEAFRLECREWHRFCETLNLIHPDAPKSLPYLCPYCNASKEIKSGLYKDH